MPTSPKIAIIGAGLAGLTAAKQLAAAGCEVTVFDKGRGVGGRMSTRRVDDQPAFDHGAQYFTVRDERFQQAVDEWISAGVVAPWLGKIVSTSGNGTFMPTDSDKTRYVGTPGMNAIARHLASQHSVQSGVQVAPPVRLGEAWQLQTTAGDSLGKFDRVIVTAPAPQATQLLAAEPVLANAAAQVNVAGCWAVMVTFAERMPLGFDGCFVNESPLSWIARNNSKPGRPEVERWVLHAGPEWSNANIELTPDAAAKQLLEVFRQVTGTANIKPTACVAHRWRYALPIEQLGAKFLSNRDDSLLAAGDWCDGPRVEGAFLSGLAVADRLMAVV